MAERSHELEGRRYEVLKLLGEGGFGRVYHARMSGAGGFSKEVAIKLLNTGNAPEHILERFRDESRILGLVRDRAIISVDPPTRLEGRWAVVMEFVDGVSCAALIGDKPVPPRVALEIIGEVARALDHVYTAPGPDGQPLNLIHRDLKPDNLQVTPAGDVKILDFGIARANFAEREAKTTANIAGTFGYIAPERMEGEELPAGDIYSLGIVLRVLVTGLPPSRRSNYDAANFDETVARVLELADLMCQPEPEDRPTARLVEAECAALAAATPGEPLRYWARETVPRAMAHREDALVGKVLTETLSTVPVHLDDRTGITRGGRIAAFAAFGTLGVTGVAGLVLLVGVLAAAIGYLAATQGRSTPVIVEPAATAAIVEPVPEEPIAPEPEDAVVDAEEPEPEPPLADPTPDPAPAATPTPRPAPKSAPTAAPAPAPKAAPKAAGPTQALTLTSVPMGADVTVDGVPVGQTPLIGFQMTEGEHRVRMTLDIHAAERTITVSKRGATKYIWTGGDEWQVRY